ncbi:MAG: hypothetical protein ACYTFY_07105 [Planctomycetota bacterium]|jgi:3D (Asp-Asp-Asp) domain-containing protein
MKTLKSFTSLLLLAAFLGWIASESNTNQPTEDMQQESVSEEGPIMLLSVHKTVTGTEADREIGSSKMDIFSSLLPGKSRDIELIPQKKEVKAETKSADRPARQAKNKETETIVAKVTAYCPCYRCCGKFANGRTSTRTNAWRQGIASDPSVIPYGTLVSVPGYGSAKVDDTGIAMRRSWKNSNIIHLDIRFQYHWQARRWGTKILKLKIKRPSGSFTSAR